MSITNKTPEELGFVPGVPGHRISYVDLWNTGNTSVWGLKEHRFACSCGLQIYAKETQRGVGVGGHKAWRDHIAAVSADPDAIFEVGVVEKERITWNVKVIHRENQHANSYSGTSNWYAGWADPNHQHYAAYTSNPWAVVIDKTSNKTNKLTRVMYHVYRSQQDAIRVAAHIIRKEEERGFKITFIDPTQANPVGQAVIVPTFRNTFSELLERTETALTGDLNDVEETIKELDEVIGLIPVLQARREELASIWDARTVGLLSK